jgi:hypothetical protein
MHSIEIYSPCVCVLAWEQRAQKLNALKKLFPFVEQKQLEVALSAAKDSLDETFVSFHPQFLAQ